MRRSGALLILYAELSLIGPRLLSSGLEFIRNSAPVDQALRFVAAQIVIELLDRDHACNVRELIKPDRSAARVLAVLRFLQESGWIDLARRRDRVWLRSPIRNRLTNR